MEEGRIRSPKDGSRFESDSTIVCKPTTHVISFEVLRGDINDFIVVSTLNGSTLIE